MAESTKELAAMLRSCRARTADALDRMTNTVAQNGDKVSVQVALASVTSEITALAAEVEEWEPEV